MDEIEQRLSATDRRSQISERVNADGFVQISDLAQELGVSEMTIRRDGEQLERAGILVRMRGGLRAVSRPVRRAPDFLARATLDQEAKERLGRVAATLVGDDQVIAVDAGTTAFQALANLDASFGGTVITHSLPALGLMESRPHVRTMGLGGELYRPSRSLVGSDAVRSAQRLRADVFFLGAASIDTRGVYGEEDIEREIKRTLIDISDRTVLMVNSEKLAASAPICTCNWDEIDVLLIDAEPPIDLKKVLQAQNVEVMVA